MFSCPQAFLTTLQCHEKSLKERDRSKRRLTQPSMGILRQQLEAIDEEFADDDLYE